jgi:hypothetical protein
VIQDGATTAAKTRARKKKRRAPTKEIPACFPALQPPSIINALPVTIALSSAARYRAAAATSSGFAILPLSCA